MVDVEAAVEIARKVLGKVMPDYLALGPHVEEFELADGGNLWNVTFRARNPDAAENPFSFYPYKDKVVQISTSDGDLIAIRNPTYN
jgi:hypothetical protein